MTPDGQRGGRPLSAARRRSSALSVVVGDERGRSGMAPGLSRWLARVAPARARGTVSVAIVNDGRVRALNRQYRGRDYATDVLSFPGDGSVSRTPRRQRTRRASASRTFLGEIVIARGVASRQARAEGHSSATELRVLALHGLLHLLGYDHETDRGEMRQIERRLRRKGGLPVGLIERAGRLRSRPGRAATATPR